jgi:allophanate hydrolase
LVAALSDAGAGWPKGLRLGVPRRDQLEFFGDKEAEGAFARDVVAAQGLGANVVEFNIEPFAEVARLLYEGPWVAERYAATKPLIEKDPGALHPVTRAIIEGAQKFDAVAAFEASYKLASLRRRTEGAWAAFEVMVVPTIPCPYTIAEVEADPVRLNSRLGTYTNFVNLLDLAAIACPSGMRGDGLPSSLTLIGPSGADGYLAGLAAEIQGRSGVPMGVTGLHVPPPALLPPAPSCGRIALAVVGAHLAGLPLNSELIALGATFLCEAKTTDDYRLYALPGSEPPKPGLLRVADGAGGAIRLELWSLDKAGFGAFIAGIPAPLGIGTIRLSDGSSAKGFLVEAEAVKGAEDITKFGGWRAYLGAR